MRNYEILPTEENLINCLEEDLFNRNVDLAYFYSLLQAHRFVLSVALDGRWGSGKTFFVKQSMLLLNAKNPMLKMDEKKRNKILEYKAFEKLKKDDAENGSLAVYYDAWENDSDIDPVLSVVYEITTQVGMEFSVSESKIYKKAGALADVITGKNISQLFESFHCENPLDSLKKQRNIQGKVKDFLSEILNDRGKHLFIFVDELDRCKPIYAVKLLERIKHYLCDDRITFVFSVNLKELQHTIKCYYGTDFDASRYLDRFFNIRVELPPANMDKFYEKYKKNTMYVSDTVCRRVIKMFGLELRETARFYSQIEAAISKPIYKSKEFDFAFGDGEALQFILIFIIPILLGLKITDIDLYNDFISGNNAQPLLDVFESEEIRGLMLKKLLADDESFAEEQNKKLVTKEQKIKELYEAVFSTDYDGVKYHKFIGQLEFNKNSKLFAKKTLSLFSNYADYSEEE